MPARAISPNSGSDDEGILTERYHCGDDAANNLADSLSEVMTKNKKAPDEMTVAELAEIGAMPPVDNDALDADTLSEELEIDTTRADPPPRSRTAVFLRRAVVNIAAISILAVCVLVVAHVAQGVDTPSVCNLIDSASEMLSSNRTFVQDELGFHGCDDQAVVMNASV